MKETKTGKQDIIVENPHKYLLPNYFIGEGLQTNSFTEIKLVRGSKLGEGVKKQKGLITENILEMCQAYLEAVNVGNMKTRQTTKAIKHIKKALRSLERRANDRAKRCVQTTYSK